MLQAMLLLFVLNLLLLGYITRVDYVHNKNNVILLGYIDQCVDKLNAQADLIVEITNGHNATVDAINNLTKATDDEIFDIYETLQTLVEYIENEEEFESLDAEEVTND